MRLLSRWWAVALVALPIAATAAPLPIKDWVRFPAVREVDISPTGKYLAVVSSSKERPMTYQLVILPTQSVIKNHPRITSHFSLSDYRIFNGVYWANDERVVASTAFQYGGFDRPFSTGALYAINAKGGQALTLLRGIGKETIFTVGRFYGGLLSLLNKQHNEILVQTFERGGSQPLATLIDIYSAKTHDVMASPIPNGGLIADHNGEVRLAYGLNSETGTPQLYYRPEDSRNWLDKSSLLGGSEAMTSLATAQPIMFGANNKTVYIAGWSDDQGQTMGLYQLDISTDKKRLLYSNPVVDVGIGAYPDTNPYITSFDGKSLVGIRIMPGAIQTLVLDSNSPRIQLLAALSKTLPNSEIEITSHTRDGSEAVVEAWGNGQVPMFYLYSDKPKPSLTPLFHEIPWVKATDVSPTRPIDYKSRDGLTIHGYLTLPRGAKLKNLPLVVYVHGGPHGIRYDWGFDPTDFDAAATQILADNGYAVLAPNYRGSGGYGFAFLRAGYRHWGDTMQNDIADAVNWAVKQGIANPNRICILGASYGGYASLMSAERFPNMFRCAVGYDGVYDLPLQETRRAVASRFAGGRLYLKTVLGDDQKQLKAFSPAFNTDSLKAAVLLLQGGEDQIAPVKGYDEMVEAIKKHSTPLETLYEPREGHGFYQPAHREKAWTEILAFLNKYIGPGVTSGSSSTESN